MNDIPKIHSKDPTPSDHWRSFEINYIKILLKLSGTFSYLYYRVPHVKELQEWDKVFITPDSDNWNPHYEYFEKMRMRWLTLRLTLWEMREEWLCHGDYSLQWHFSKLICLYQEPWWAYKFYHQQHICIWPRKYAEAMQFKFWSRFF